MNDFYDTLEAVGHTVFTALAFCVAHWEAIGGITLMLLQGVYLCYKIKQKRKECQ